MKKHNPDDCPKKPNGLKQFKGIEKDCQSAKFCDDCEGEIFCYPIFPEGSLSPINLPEIGF